MYHDLLVSEIQESVMQETRLHTGYVFFCMHDEIFFFFFFTMRSFRSC